MGEPILIGGNRYKLTIILHIEATVFVNNAVDKQEAEALAKKS